MKCNRTHCKKKTKQEVQPQITSSTSKTRHQSYRSNFYEKWSPPVADAKEATIQAHQQHRGQPKGLPSTVSEHTSWNCASVLSAHDHTTSFDITLWIMYQCLLNLTMLWKSEWKTYELVKLKIEHKDNSYWKTEYKPHRKVKMRS